MKSIALVLLLSSSSAIRVNDVAPDTHPNPVRPLAFHWNEDPHSVPDPMNGKAYQTSTQARFKAENSTANIRSTEPKGPQPTDYKFGPYNANDKEYVGHKLDEGAQAGAEAKAEAQAEQEAYEGEETEGDVDSNEDLDEIDAEYGGFESDDDEMNIGEESDLEMDDEPEPKEKANVQLGQKW